MKPVKVSFVGNAAYEWEKLNKIIAEERSEGMENSENQQLLKSIKQKIELIRFNLLEVLFQRSSYPKSFP